MERPLNPWKQPFGYDRCEGPLLTQSGHRICGGVFDADIGVAQYLFSGPKLQYGSVRVPPNYGKSLGGRRLRARFFVTQSTKRLVSMVALSTERLCCNALSFNVLIGSG